MRLQWKLRHLIDVVMLMLGAFAFAAILLAFTEKFYEEKEEQDGRVQDIIIRGKLYNCEEVNSK